MRGVTQDPLGPRDPDPASVDLARVQRHLDALPGLATLARDLAAWSETVEADSCDTEILADLEELGRRAHELVRVMDGGLS